MTTPPGTFVSMACPRSVPLGCHADTSGSGSQALGASSRFPWVLGEESRSDLVQLQEAAWKGDAKSVSESSPHAQQWPRVATQPCT